MTKWIQARKVETKRKHANQDDIQAFAATFKVTDAEDMLPFIWERIQPL